jgi:acetamidase/formamidase
MEISAGRNSHSLHQHGFSSRTIRSDQATRIAVRQMIDFLATEKEMSREDAYMLISVAGDVDITELVDGNKGVHVMLPKAVFKN